MNTTTKTWPGRKLSKHRSSGPPRCGWPRPSTNASPTPSTHSGPRTGADPPIAPNGTSASWSPTSPARPTFCQPRARGRANACAQARQQPGQPQVDALTALQIEERQHLAPEELRAELHRVGPRGAKGRRRIPGFLRRRRMPGVEIVNGAPEAWSLGYVSDVILTRDAWMHRLDLARATGQDLVLTADHDGIIVADVVAEWARRHGQPYRLELTGPAGGSWSSDTSGEQIVMDAADFCRVVAGRPGPDGGQACGLLSTQVPF